MFLYTYKQVQVPPQPDMQADKRRGSTVLLILHLGAQWKLVLNATHWPL